jgi:dephospho-CoA kinase
MPTRRVPIIGVIGGIGSGKTAFSRALEAEGCRLIEADKVGHEMLRKAEVFCELVTEFGEEIIGGDGQIDRPALAARAFATDASARRLNEIVGRALWPEFRRRALEAADHADAASVAAVVLDAALLLEAECEDLCDAVVFVDAPEAARRQRVEQGRHWGWDEVLRRESRQFPLSRKRERADFVVENHAGLAALASRARDVLARVRERFSHGRESRTAETARRSGGPAGPHQDD